jgi:hypothetical protein
MDVPLKDGYQTIHFRLASIIVEAEIFSNI